MPLHTIKLICVCIWRSVTYCCIQNQANKTVSWTTHETKPLEPFTRFKKLFVFILQKHLLGQLTNHSLSASCHCPMLIFLSFGFLHSSNIAILRGNYASLLSTISISYSWDEIFRLV